ncbi:MAG: hypothetical protein AB1714_29835 [Acidobacteriota bacterium]
MKGLEDRFGSTLPRGTLQITLFVPSVDRDGVRIDQDYWREETLRIFGTLFRGATAFPPGRGVWRDDERGGELVFDDTVLVTSYADPMALTDEVFAELRRFVHRLGRESNQGEVGIVVGGEYYGIKDFDLVE